MQWPGEREERGGVAARGLWLGVAFWVVFACAAVALRGVQWEENYERAQLIAGTVRYPADHPFYQYTYDVLTPHYLLSAAAVALGAGPALVCGFWNVAFLLGTVLPMFLLTSLVTRRPLWGHVAALLALLGVQVAFAPYYPLGVWPAQFSIGQTGAACALLILFLLAGGYWRAGYFLLSLMPLIHIGQMPAPLIVGVLFAGHLWAHGKGPSLKPVIPWCAAGLTVSAAFWLVKATYFAVPLPTEGPYFSPAGWHEIWRRYTFTHDVHRGFPRFAQTGHAVFMALSTLLLGLAAARWEFLRKRPVEQELDPTGRNARPYFWFLIFTVSSLSIVGACAAVHTVLGDKTPFLVIGWAPYRLVNYAVLIHIVTALGILAQRDGGAAGPAVVTAVLAYALVRPLFQHLFPETLYTRYFGLPEALLFVLSGGAFATLVRLLKDDRRFLVPWVVASATCGVAFAGYHQFGSFCLLVGFVGTFIAGWVAGRWAAFGRVATDLRLLTALWALVLAHAVYQQGCARNHLSGDPFDRQVTEYLAARGESDAMILGPHFQIRFQERMGHPFLVTFETCHFMSYVPKLAPALEKMYAELFDIRFGTPWGYDLNAWVNRPCARWRKLAGIYSFRYVLCPNVYALDLVPVLRGSSYTLYEIPETGKHSENGRPGTPVPGAAETSGIQ
jgi:hypothetical protein